MRRTKNCVGGLRGWLLRVRLIVRGAVVGSRRMDSRARSVGRWGVVGISGMMIGIVRGIRGRSTRVAIGVRALRGRIVGRRHRGGGEGVRSDGLTEQEGVVMDALCDAANAFGRLDRQHPDEERDFCDGIHRCQYALAVRIARRAFPVGWPVKRPSGELADVSAQDDT